MLCSVRTGTDLWAHRVSDTSPGSVWALKVRPGCPCGESERSFKASSRCRYRTSESVDNRVLQNGCVGRANRSLEQGASSRRVPQMREGNKKREFQESESEGQGRAVEGCGALCSIRMGIPQSILSRSALSSAGLLGDLGGGRGRRGVAGGQGARMRVSRSSQNATEDGAQGTRQVCHFARWTPKEKRTNHVNQLLQRRQAGSGVDEMWVVHRMVAALSRTVKRLTSRGRHSGPELRALIGRRASPVDGTRPAKGPGVGEGRGLTERPRLAGSGQW